MTRLIQAALSQENYSQEEQSLEYEYEWYVEAPHQLDTFLQGLPRTHLEQAEYPLIDPEGNRIGVLRSRRYDHEESVVTIKKKGDMGSIESTIDGDGEMFSTIRQIAHGLYQKFRYQLQQTIHHNGQDLIIHWEIDRYLLPDQSFHPILKIDLEVPTPEVAPPALPWTNDQTIVQADILLFNGSNTHHGSDLTDQDKKWLDALFESVRHPIPKE